MGALVPPRATSSSASMGTLPPSWMRSQASSPSASTSSSSVYSLPPSRASSSSVCISGPSASRQWTVSVPGPSDDALQRQIAEQQVVIAVQSNMLSAVAGQGPALEDEMVRTLTVFQRNQEGQQAVINSLVDENRQLRALLSQEENRRLESERIHAAEKAAADQVINAMRAQIAALTNRMLAVENKADQACQKATSVTTRFDGHTHSYGVPNIVGEARVLGYTPKQSGGPSS